MSQVNPETVDLSISVKDDQDSPVSGATVSIDEISSTTGSAGGCTLSNVPTGIQTITVTKEGYDEYSDSITVSTENISFDIILTPTG
ncbi:MAG: carboxypeptidase regulatory-like domain-containing protein [Methanobrevibacter sp.]|uniref:carboxypeptidase regulatory-like domain-containing protein n=1 Tax=Methanobrevibacter sp. TaxID=66852 RepID=UPI0025FD8340|nr:carboxypeptidase regulatory-like domain-containing protein [Methanobrevibacter sp.]MBE6508258.1 carboxypeptidase regulatory-like domain-containing protein [Methanobrevibacter sp.]